MKKLFKPQQKLFLTLMLAGGLGAWAKLSFVGGEGELRLRPEGLLNRKGTPTRREAPGKPWDPRLAKPLPP